MPQTARDLEDTKQGAPCVAPPAALVQDMLGGARQGLPTRYVPCSTVAHMKAAGASPASIVVIARSSAAFPRLRES